MDKKFKINRSKRFFRTFCFFVIVLFSTITAKTQTITYTFTGIDSAGIWFPFNHVTITNLTRNWQERIYYPDTIFILENNVSINDDYLSTGSGFHLQVSPNPFDGFTEILLTLPDDGNVQLELFDIYGRHLTQKSLPLTMGKHLFKIAIASPQTCLLRATQQQISATAKLINMGYGGRNEIKYVGNESFNPFSFQNQKRISSNPYAFGDQMKFIGYDMSCSYPVTSQTITQPIAQSDSFTLIFNIDSMYPIVTTTVPTNIGTTTAVCGGTVIHPGCTTLTARGVCWSTLPAPTLNNQHIQNGNTLGNFTVNLFGLNDSTTYYVRAYATNPLGTTYGNEETFTTIACPSAFSSTSATICSNDQYWWQGNNYNQTGIYQDSVLDNNGCFSIYELNLTVNPAYSFNTYDTICSGQNLFWHGNTFHLAGTYSDTLSTLNGCDSIVTLNLFVNPPITFTFFDTICQGGNYIFNGNNISTAGTYSDTLSTLNGCDSIVTLNLFVNPPIAFTFHDTICQGGTYIFNGNNISAAGTYSDTLSTLNGCDSIVTLNLFVNPPIAFAFHDTICQGGNYIFNGNNISAAGTYSDTLSTLDGCDSIVTLNLFVNPPITFAFHDTICQGGTYIFNGNNISAAGSYSDTLSTLDGCDSIVTLNLFVNPPIAFTFFDTICQGGNYNFNGNNISAAGTYSDTLSTLNGCDSIITLNLFVNPSPNTFITDSICQGNNYNFNGTLLTTAGIYNDTLTSQTGCDSIVTLNLTINPTNNIFITDSICQDDSYHFNGRTLTASGTYIDTLTSTTGCDSIVTLNLKVNPKYFFRETASIIYGGSYSWHGLTITETGLYFDSLLTTGGCDSIYVLSFIAKCAGTPTITDIDNNIYNTVYIGTQCWTRENMKTTRYANGVSIPLSNSTSTNIAYRYNPGGNAANVATYGYLYNWKATMGTISAGTNSNPSGVQGICPTGWHIPSQAEWNQLTTYLYSQNRYLCNNYYIGKALAEDTLWGADSWTCSIGNDLTYNNASGLSSMPAGWYAGYASGLGWESLFWLTSNYGDYASAAYLSYDYNAPSIYSESFNFGFSVRCIKGTGTLLICPDTLIKEEISITYGNSLSWHGQTLTETGIYYDTLTSASGCDSIHQLTLTINCPSGATTMDIDHNTYHTVQIGTQCWMKENLKTTRYANGTTISLGGYNYATNTAYRYNPNDNGNLVATYGYLYNWAAVMGTSTSSNRTPSHVQGPCPNGWHIPSRAEWNILTNYVSSRSQYLCNGGIIKALSNDTGWNNSGLSCTPGYDLPTNNRTGFSALPAGYHIYSSCYGLGYYAYFWTCTEYSSTYAYNAYFEYDLVNPSLNRNEKYYGYSVRCIENPQCNDTVISTSATIYYGNSYSWRGHTFTAEGTYYDSLTTAQGCDSIFQLNLQVLHGYPCTGIPTVSDIDGNIYNTVQIGTQCWMRENLKTTRYDNGDPITLTTNSTSTSTYYRYYPNNASANVSTYGYLYNWAATMKGAAPSDNDPSGVQGPCPAGWHVPSNSEWSVLTNYVSNQSSWWCSGYSSYIAKALSSTTGWNTSYSYCAPGTVPADNNLSGFAAMPAGYYSYSNTYFGQYAYYWSTSQYTYSYSYYFSIYYTSSTISNSGSPQSYAMSIRCLKD